MTDNTAAKFSTLDGLNDFDPVEAASIVNAIFETLPNDPDDALRVLYACLAAAIFAQGRSERWATVQFEKALQRQRKIGALIDKPPMGSA